MSIHEIPEIGVFLESLANDLHICKKKYMKNL